MCGTVAAVAVRLAPRTPCNSDSLGSDDTRQVVKVNEQVLHRMCTHAMHITGPEQVHCAVAGHLKLLGIC